MAIAEGFEEFVEIVDGGSLTAAAESMGLPRPTLSRRLARLEERLGVRLLHRTTRRQQLTSQGETLYAKARQVVQTAQEVENMVRRSDGVPRGLLRVSVPTETIQTPFAGWIADFLKQYPEVQIEWLASSVHVDLVAEGIDVVLRAGVIDDPSLVVRTLVTNRLVAIATPQYLQEFGTPTSVEDLEGHNCILGYRSGRLPELSWPLWNGTSVKVTGTLSCNQVGFRVKAALQHVGIAMVIDHMVRQEIREGKLVVVLEDVIGRPDRVCLAYPDRAYLEPKVRSFIDFMVERMDVARAARLSSESP